MGHLDTQCEFWTKLCTRPIDLPPLEQITGAAGFRLDAIKHMDRRFLVEFVSP